MKKLITLLLICTFAFPALAIEEQENDSTINNQESIETITTEDAIELNNDNTLTPEAEMLPSDKNLPIKYKEPINKRKIAKKFLIAMLCVAGTSVFLYGVLSIYNRFRSDLNMQIFSSSNEPSPLDTPQDISLAVKSFIEKTHWD